MPEGGVYPCAWSLERGRYRLWVLDHRALEARGEDLELLGWSGPAAGDPELHDRRPLRHRR